jgi:hypothetical protein
VDPQRRIRWSSRTYCGDNRDAASVLRDSRANPTLVLCVETDEWWREQLEWALKAIPTRSDAPSQYLRMLLYRGRSSMRGWPS